MVAEEITLADDLAEKQRWLRDLENSTSRLSGQYHEVYERLDHALKTMNAAKGESELLDQVTTLLQGLETAWQKNFQESVAKVISRGLSLVFQEPMELRILPSVKRDVTVVEFKIVQGVGDSAIETDILGAKGGTVIALVNVLVRALLILSARPALRRILILDEPFGLADDSYIPSFGVLLRELCDQLGFQVFIVSHEAALVDVADTAHEAYLTKRNGTSFRPIREKNEVHA